MSLIFSRSIIKKLDIYQLKILIGADSFYELNLTFP